MRTQKLVADYLSAHGFPYAESTGAGRPGSDVTNTPGITWEVKARSDLAPLAWVRQAVANTRRGELPVVVFRSNGQGEDAGNYLAMLRLGDLVTVLRDAGYGTPLDATPPGVYPPGMVPPSTTN